MNGLAPAPGIRPPRPSRGATPAPDAVRVVSVERFRLMGSRLDVADVTLDVRGLRLRALVRATAKGYHVAFPTLRGEAAVAFTAPALEAEVKAAALGAAGGLGA